jgi:uncharacterized protein (TIGR03086 family)
VGIVELHERALDQTASIVAGVKLDQLVLPTPCTEWDVRTLLEHLIGGNWRFAALAEGGTLHYSSETEDVVGDDPAAEYERSAEALKQAWRKPSRLGQVYELPIGPLPGEAALTLHVVETITHGWDLAQATGQTPRYDDDIVEQATMFARSAHERGVVPRGTTFAAPVDCPDNLPAIDRLAAFLGREPA